MPGLETDLSTNRQWLDLSLAERALPSDAYSLLCSARLGGEWMLMRHDGPLAADYDGTRNGSQNPTRLRLEPFSS